MLAKQLNQQIKSLIAEKKQLTAACTESKSQKTKTAFLVEAKIVIQKAATARKNKLMRQEHNQIPLIL